MVIRVIEGIINLLMFLVLKKTKKCMIQPQAWLKSVTCDKKVLYECDAADSLTQRSYCDTRQ